MQTLHHRHEFCDHNRRQSERHLIDAEHFGIQQERFGHGQLLLFAAGEASRFSAAVHGERGKRIVDQLSSIFGA